MAAVSPSAPRRYPRTILPHHVGHISAAVAFYDETPCLSICGHTDNFSEYHRVTRFARLTEAVDAIRVAPSYPACRYMAQRHVVDADAAICAYRTNTPTTTRMPGTGRSPPSWRSASRMEQATEGEAVASIATVLLPHCMKFRYFHIDNIA